MGCCVCRPGLYVCLCSNLSCCSCRHPSPMQITRTPLIHIDIPLTMWPNLLALSVCRTCAVRAFLYMQQPIVLQLPTSVTNRHHADQPHQQQPRTSFSGSFTGLKLPKLLSGHLHRHSSGSEFGTPLSNASRWVSVGLLQYAGCCSILHASMAGHLHRHSSGSEFGTPLSNASRWGR